MKVSKRLLHMTVAHVYRITFKQRNCMVTIKQDKITHNEKGMNNKVS